MKLMVDEMPFYYDGCPFCKEDWSEKWVYTCSLSNCNCNLFEKEGECYGLKRVKRETDGTFVEVVRCQDCKHWVYNFNGCSRNPCTEPWHATDFCNYGEREGE